MNYNIGKDIEKRTSPIFHFTENIKGSNILSDVSNVSRAQNFIKVSTASKLTDSISKCIGNVSYNYSNANVEDVNQNNRSITNPVETNGNGQISANNLTNTSNQTNLNGHTNANGSASVEASSRLSDDRDMDYHESSRTKRKPRTVFSRNQLARMKDAFSQKPYLTTEERRSLANDLGVSSEQVKVWFQNHRSKLKRHGRMVGSSIADLTNLTGGVGNPHGIPYGSTLQNYNMNQQPMGNTYNTYLRPGLAYTNDNQQHYEYMTPQVYQMNECFQPTAQYTYQNAVVTHPQQNNSFIPSGVITCQPNGNSSATLPMNNMVPKVNTYSLDMGNLYKPYTGASPNLR